MATRGQWTRTQTARRPAPRTRPPCPIQAPRQSWCRTCTWRRATREEGDDRSAPKGAGERTRRAGEVPPPS
eukprot:7580766-Alexandrium_andersonii.AAC.1